MPAGPLSWLVPFPMPHFYGNILLFRIYINMIKRGCSPAEILLLEGQISVNEFIIALYYSLKM